MKFSCEKKEGSTFCPVYPTECCGHNSECIWEIWKVNSSKDTGNQNWKRYLNRQGASCFFLFIFSLSFFLFFLFSHQSEGTVEEVPTSTTVKVLISGWRIKIESSRKPEGTGKSWKGRCWRTWFHEIVEELPCLPLMCMPRFNLMQHTEDSEY